MACDLGALTEPERVRRAELAARFRPLLAGVRAKGGELRLPLGADEAIWRDAAELAGYESRCCPFLDFRLEAPGGGADRALVVAGTPEGLAVLSAGIGGCG